MAYTGRENTGNRDTHGWAIAGAFAGQAAIIVGIGALLAGIGTPAATQMSAAPAPAVYALQPAVSALPANIPYEVTIDGQQGGALFPAQPSSVPTFTVQPGQDLAASLDVTMPPGLSVTGLSVRLVGTVGGTGTADIQTPYNDSVQAQAPGTQVFMLTWPGSASELRPGTQWTLYMTPGPGRDAAGAPIAHVNVAS